MIAATTTYISQSQASPSSENGLRSVADHSLAGGDHASDQRFPVLAVTGPFPKAEQAVGDLPKTGSRRARIRGVERMEPAG
jgi:hypothetical protein